MNTHPIADAAPSDSLVPAIQIMENQNRFFIHYDNTTGPLPLVPLTITNACATAADLFWQRSSRCCAIVLLLDVASRHWSWVIPRQTCSRDGCCWQAPRRELLSNLWPGSWYVAGSFQTRVVEHEEDVLDHVPPVPGVHFVQIRRGDNIHIFTFLRLGPEDVRCPTRELVLQAGWATVEEALPRMTLR